MKIRYRLSLTTLLFLSLALILMSSLFFIYTSSVITQKSEEYLEQTLYSGTLMIHNLLEASRVETSYLSKNVLVTQALLDAQQRNSNLRIEDYPIYVDLNSIFENIIHSDRGIRAAFVIDETGKVIASGHPESIGLDLYDRDYFKEAMSGNLTISSLLYDKLHNLASLFVASPVIDTNTNQTLGVMSLIIDTQTASMNLSSLMDDKQGSAFLMNDEGLIIFHSEPNLIGTYHRSPSVQNYLKKNLNMGSGFQNYNFDGSDYHIAFKRIPSSPWLLVIEQNMNIYKATVREALLFVIGINFLILALVAFSYLRYAKLFTDPISELSDVVHQTTTGNLMIRSQYMSNDELGQLSRDFNSMLDELVGAYEEVESKNEELTATEEELRSQNNRLIEQQDELNLSKKRVEELAFTNPLTKQPNRIACEFELERLLSTSPLQSFSLLHLDIDAFMRVNYSLGHSFGDRVLIETANQLHKLVHSNALLYHISADKFAYILIDSPNESTVSEFANAILDLFAYPLMIDNREIYLSISIGISTCPNDSVLSEVLKLQAETALYQAKTTGKSQYLLYNKVMTEQVNRRLEVEAILRHSVKDNLLYMMYQPQYRAHSQKLQSFEALMRLKSLSGLNISPAEFIPIAEDTGLIIELSEWMIDNVFAQVRSWLSEGALFDYVCINISGYQLKDPKFVDLISNALATHQISSHQIELEVTESILLDISSLALNSLEQLKALGFRIALDDFGTGYSSLSYLKTLPINTLKIDKSFIDDIHNSKKDQDLVRQLIGLSHELSLQVVAEGVEKKSQLQFLQENNCDLIQGYYFSKPLTTEAVERLLLN